MKKIVFVCLGNICRSPMAEFVMKNLIKQSGCDADFQIESRATSSWEHGNPIHPGTQRIFEEKGIEFDLTKSSQQITARDFEAFDQIIAMDESNLEKLKQLAPEGTAHKIQMLLEQSVPDPWYTGDFEETYSLISKGCRQFLD